MLFVIQVMFNPQWRIGYVMLCYFIAKLLFHSRSFARNDIIWLIFVSQVK